MGSIPVLGQEAALLVTGDVKAPVRLSMEELRKMPGTRAEIKGADGKTAVYEGVALFEILRRAEVPLGESLRGPALSLCVMVKAADGRLRARRAGSSIHRSESGAGLAS